MSYLYNVRAVYLIDIINCMSIEYKHGTHSFNYYIYN